MARTPVCTGTNFQTTCLLCFGTRQQQQQNRKKRNHIIDSLLTTLSAFWYRYRFRTHYFLLKDFGLPIPGNVTANLVLSHIFWANRHLQFDFRMRTTTWWPSPTSANRRPWCSLPSTGITRRFCSAICGRYSSRSAHGPVPTSRPPPGSRRPFASNEKRHIVEGRREKESLLSKISWHREEESTRVALMVVVEEWSNHLFCFRTSYIIIFIFVSQMKEISELNSCFNYF